MCLIPAQLPTEFQVLPAGILIAAMVPVEAARQFMLKTLMESRPLSEVGLFLVAPAVVTALILGLLFSFAASHLRLEAGTTGKRWWMGSRVEAVE